MGNNFDFIPEKDRDDAEKRSIIMAGPQAHQMAAIAMTSDPSKFGYGAVLTRFCDKEQVTVNWCKQFVAEVKAITGRCPDYLQIDVTPDKMVKYNVKANCLRVFEGRYPEQYPVYENNNGVICRDKCALQDCLM